MTDPVLEAANRLMHGYPSGLTHEQILERTVDDYQLVAGAYILQHTQLAGIRASLATTRRAVRATRGQIRAADQFLADLDDRHQALARPEPTAHKGAQAHDEHHART